MNTLHTIGRLATQLRTRGRRDPVDVRKRRRRRVVAAVVSVTGVGGGGIALLLLLTVGALLAAAPGQATAQATGIPPVVMAAYLNAQTQAPQVADGCEVGWPIIAGIWRVESIHGTINGTTIGDDGEVTPPIYGVTLDGTTPGTAVIPDTDNGALDNDPVWDRAVGPAQFLPTSWAALGHDANSDGKADPQNVYDAALATVAHLCVWSPGDYTNPTDLEAALLRYNHDPDYVATVLDWIAYYTAYTITAGDVAADGLYAFPLPHDTVTLAQIQATHHDYPAADLPVPDGTRVYAAHPGTITALSTPCPDPLECRCGYGVHITGRDTHHYTYCHGQSIPTGITLGATVTAGQLIMVSGNTGNSTGPHFHFQIRTPTGDLLCPQPLLAAWWNGTGLSPISAPTTGCTH